MGSIPAGDSNFVFFPRSCHVDYFIFIIPLLRHFTIFGHENGQNMSP